jgi:hypothetical protein
MVFAALPTLQKNSLSTTTTSNMTTSSTEVEVAEQAVFYRAGVLLTHGWELGPDNAVEFRTEEVIVSATDGVSGPGTVTFSTRAVKADGTNGPAYAWLAGTRIRNTFSTSVYDQIRDNFTALPQSRNLIINGDCRVNQRVTAFTLVKDEYPWDLSDLYGPDRHEGMATGTAVSAGTWGQTVTATAGNSGYAFKFAGVTLTGTGILYHRYRMEALDAVRFKNQSASFSCSVYHDVGSAINYTIYVRKANAADNFSAVTAISNSGAISVPSATKTLLKYENISLGDVSNGIEIEIKIESGAITTKNFEQTELQFERGPVCTAFECRNIGIEYYLCRNYSRSFYKIGVINTVAGFGVAVSTTEIYIQLTLTQRLRASPTLTFSQCAISDLNSGGSVTAMSILSADSTEDVIFLSVTCSGGGLIAGNAYYLLISISSGGNMILSSEL